MMPGGHPADLTVDELLKSCEIRFTRASGPGGQHRNKVETAVVITHLPTGVSGQASERRSQHRNREEAIQRLRTSLAVEVRALRGRLDRYQPSETWRSRLRGRRIEISGDHPDFPGLLAEVLDLMFENDSEPGQVAAVLGCSTTQLIRLVGRDARALAAINRRRAELGKHPLR